ncbi:cytochrome P460 family protein [Nisaea nitritireducens]|uniref:cytochrome P460 family protein n=1 Tax=Nisaea nitritireducens TaxID=568392 RepID=UPI0018692BDD|nr:cytochrome P460 family protein [Nisaea nitritireducens]
MKYTRASRVLLSASAGLMGLGIVAGLTVRAEAESMDTLEARLDAVWNHSNQLAASASTCTVKRVEDAWKASGSPKKVKGKADLTDEEAKAAYECIKATMYPRFAKSDLPGAKEFHTWNQYNTQPYQSGTHGNRYVNNWGNDTGNAYGGFEETKSVPVGTVLAKDGFHVTMKGEVKRAPLFTMVKKEDGFNVGTLDWEYALIFPNGKTMGVTNGKNSKKVQFCADCHNAAEDNDGMFFLPDEYRVSSN